MRLFANQGALSKMLEKSFGDDEMLEHGTLDWSIQNAQKKWSSRTIQSVSDCFNMMMFLNRQREIVYSIRNDVLVDDPGKTLFELVEEEVDERLATVPENEYKANKLEDMPEFESLVASWVNVTFPLNLSAEEFVGKGEEGCRSLLLEKN